jgi:hypothetical protein
VPVFAFQERIPFEVRTREPPRSSTAQARLQLEVSREGDALSILPTLVYGDPPVARVDAGNLVLLGDRMPARDELRKSGSRGSSSPSSGSSRATASASKSAIPVLPEAGEMRNRPDLGDRMRPLSAQRGRRLA